MDTLATWQGLIGVAVGSFLTFIFSIGADRRRVRNEDSRRWLADRRTVYARFLGLVESMHAEFDRTAVFLSYDGRKPASDEDRQLMREGLYAYFSKWEDELQPLLGEVQLLASPKVADLADRVSGALMEITTQVETEGTFSEYYPEWFQADDLINVTRNAMREELGLEAMESDRWELRRGNGWPRLDERPPRESYVQQHDGGLSLPAAAVGHAGASLGRRGRPR